MIGQTPKKVEISENDEFTMFAGVINAFKHIKEGIIHNRIVKVYKNKVMWEIEDNVLGIKENVNQIWHISPEFYNLGFVVESEDSKGITLKEEERDVYYSNTYGEKAPSKALVFTTDTMTFKTKIYKR